MRGILIVIVVAVAHSFASLVCGIGDLATGGFFAKIISPSDPVFGSIKEALEFPLLTLFHMQDVRADAILLPLMIANSFLWGVAVYLLVVFFGKVVVVEPDRPRRR
jgi:hypothetical protein